MPQAGEAPKPRDHDSGMNQLLMLTKQYELLTVSIFTRTTSIGGS